jgi:hypothetical protein
VSYAVSANMPDGLYTCYDLPQRTILNWNAHFADFNDYTDFEEAFVQNLVGNVITFADIYDKSKAAGEE